MVKPLWALAGVALLGTAGFVGALVVASSGGEEEVIQQVETATPPVGTPAETPTITPSPAGCDPNPSPPPGTKLWRWVNVTVLLPDEPGFLAFPETIPAEVKPPEGGLGLNIRAFDPSNNTIWSSVVIDAQDGSMLREEVRPEHQAAMQEAKETAAVCPFDPATAQWPYNGEPQTSAKREVWFGMSILRPDPATGIIVEISIGSSGGRGEVSPAECEIAGKSMSVSNGRSTAFVWVDANTESLCKDVSYVKPEDSDAFQRYLSDVMLCGKEIDC